MITLSNERPGETKSPERPDLALPVGTTLDRYILHRQSAFRYATGELSQLLRDIALASKIIHREINRAGLMDITGSAGSGNIQGETQQKLDVVANIRFIRALKNGGEVCAIISEEDDDIIHTGNSQAKYVVAIDPLDGSSNIDVNVSIGTIFSIYRRVSPVGTEATEADFLQGGRQQIAAGYILYGSSTLLVFTTGSGVSGFTYDISLGEYILSHADLRQPEAGFIFSCNDGNVDDYPVSVQRYLFRCKQQRLTGRYIGSLVADFHRNLIKGGIYLYPPTLKAPAGKLRLLYECYPMAFIAEQAGGKATNGLQPILDIVPVSLHQRSVLYIGSRTMVEEV
ncbi:class 1 fructose-bisphosphatase [Spirosoma utsteinense]|uniref:Fructose-1,6-bisphosphatase class 1 n=1 Tax=Spirosoma utsteinense TaxID=2585773 RepID=A0ABR6W7G2_9BACT|nr:class 1 fructose-bisphosphatase [Spirosoma utsteinense]MBC3788720.1 fructose-1,6-bisphosphatase I [Spirosoma utsteinense]MBC3792513.1 fructose-1,6-bisphosphatase I [Spirosoma utsteinense]